MPALTPSQYANASRCYECEIPPGAQLGVAIYLLAKLYQLSVPMADITPNALMNAARCFTQCIPDGAQFGVANYLLDQVLLNGGGGGGGGCCNDLQNAPFDRVNFPNNEPAPPTITVAWNRSFRDGSPSIVWDSVNLVWLVL